MGELAALTDLDRDESVQLAHYIVEAVRDDLVFPLSVEDPNAQDDIVRMARYLIELVEPVQDRSVTIDSKFDKESAE